MTGAARSLSPPSCPTSELLSRHRRTFFTLLLFLFLAREAHARPSVLMQEGMGRPVSPQQLPGSDPAGRHQRAAEEQPLPQRLLEGQRTFISCPAQVTSCRSSVHSPACLSVCLSAVPGGPPRGQGPVDQQDQGAPGALREDQRDGESAPVWPIQSNKQPPKEVCSSCLL